MVLVKRFGGNAKMVMNGKRQLQIGPREKVAHFAEKKRIKKFVDIIYTVEQQKYYT